MNKPPFLYGVNLGGWFVVERWITPSLFAGTVAVDHYSLVRTSNGAARLEVHYASFIKESDFAWLRQHGINAVRVPIGFWALADELPLVAVKKQLDWLFAMASKYDIQVLLVMHAAPGSQNGNDHSGRVGRVRWYEVKNRDKTRSALHRIAEKYANHPQLYGIELLNEPKVASPLQYLRLLWWSRRAVRELHRRYPNLTIVYSDAFMPRLWTGRIKNAVLDVHHYQAFSSADKQRTISGHIEKVHAMERNIAKWQRTQPIIIGEWSLGLDNASLQGVDRRDAEKRFGSAQLKAYKSGAGWFFWNYKTEQNGGWNYRYLVEEKMLPNLANKQE